MNVSGDLSSQVADRGSASRCEYNSIPDSWIWIRVRDICQVLVGYGFPKRMQGNRSGDLPFYKVGDISEAWQQKKTYLTEANHYLTLNEAVSINATPLPKGSTVFAKIGAAIALNRRAILAAPFPSR